VCRIIGLVRGTLSDASFDALVDAFLSRKFLFFSNRATYFHTNGTVHSTPSVEAYAHSVGAQTVVGTAVRAQFNFTRSPRESCFALAFTGGFVAHPVLVAIVWASADIARCTSPCLGAILAGFAVTFSSHGVASSVPRAVFRAFFVATVGTKKRFVA